MSYNVDFQLEVKKLAAINTVNLDIWSRLSSSVILEGPMFGSELSVYLVYPYTKSVEFDGAGNLSFKTANMKVKLRSFEPFFEDINIFNMTLPTQHYFDLLPSVEKLRLLDFTLPSNQDLIRRWRESMEEIHLYLGDLETAMYEAHDMSQRVRMIFGLLENKHERRYTSPLLPSCPLISIFIPSPSFFVVD
eukprot:TRINITY_DN2131_c0_g1_i1.p1 TRINITY_DN2131_c0_g1~~TRINITY_DN2131_c0_g1_i1.p1  ORF type:complete len:200 (+),score=23.46 TRINITY_DN2131_c0_g1_i1:28-600(+)